MKQLMHGALLAGLAVSALSNAAWAQDARSRPRNNQPPAAIAPIAQSTLLSPSTPSPLSQTLIDELTVSDNTMTVRKLLPILKEKVPAFQYIAEDGPWADQHVPVLELRNVTILEVFDVLQRWNPSFHWDVVSGGNGNTGVPIIILGHDRPSAPATYSGFPTVQVFSLSAAIDRQLDRDGIGHEDRNKQARKKATAEVMSLLENVATEASLPGAPLQISIHDDTETILVKGYSNQSEAVSRAVMSFNPPAGAASAQRVELVAGSDKTAIAAMRSEIMQLDQKLRERDQDLASLKSRVESLLKTNSPDATDKK